MPKRRQRLFTPGSRSDPARRVVKGRLSSQPNHPPEAPADWTAAFYATKVVGKDATADQTNPAIGSFRCCERDGGYSVYAISVLIHRDEEADSGLLLVTSEFDRVSINIRTAWVVFAGDPCSRFSVDDDLDCGWRCCRQGAGRAEAGSWCALSHTQRCPFRNFRLFRVRGKGLPTPAEFGTGVPTRAYCMRWSEEEFGAVHRFMPKNPEGCDWVSDFHVTVQPTIEVCGTKIVSLPGKVILKRTEEQLAGYIRDALAMEGLVKEVASVLPVNDLPELIAEFAGVKVGSRLLFEGQRVRSRVECKELYGFE